MTNCARALMIALEEIGPATLRQLGAHTGFDPTTINGAMNYLTDIGVVAREEIKDWRRHSNRKLGRFLYQLEE